MTRGFLKGLCHTLVTCGLAGALFIPSAHAASTIDVPSLSQEQTQTTINKESLASSIDWRVDAYILELENENIKLAFKDEAYAQKALELLFSQSEEEARTQGLSDKPRIVLKDAGARALKLRYEKSSQPAVQSPTRSIVSKKEGDGYTLRAGRAAKSELFTPEEAAAFLKSGRTIATSYTVEPGESLADIEQKTHLTAQSLARLNPEKDLSKLSDGMILNTERHEPLINTHYEVEEVGERYTPYDVIFVDDDTLMVGEYDVVTQGTYGVAKIHRTFTIDGGRNTGEKILSEETIKEPTAAVIRRGTAKADLIAWPTHGPITSPFGERTWEDGVTEFHRGIDIAVPLGTPIGAAMAGTVTFAGEMGSYGNVVFIDHGNGLETRYAHLNEVQVRVGEKVRQLEAVGTCGTTGNSTGPHLHFETIFKGELIDPLRFLPE